MVVRIGHVWPQKGEKHQFIRVLSKFRLHSMGTTNSTSTLRGIISVVLGIVFIASPLSAVATYPHLDENNGSEIQFENTCPYANSLYDTTVEQVASETGYALNLQGILDDAASNVDVILNQMQTQLWYVDDGAEISIDATHIDNVAGYESVFGYYSNADLETFSPMFKTAEIVGYESVPLVTSGQAHVQIPTAGHIGFAIKVFKYDEPKGVFATQNSLNSNGTDQAVVYNTSADTYALAFDDMDVESDNDFNDFVVEVKLGCVAMEVPTDDNTGGNGGNGGGSGQATTTGTLIVQGTLINNNGGTSTIENFGFSVGGASTTPFESDGENSVTLTPGAYTVTASTTAGYTASSTNCTDIALASNETKTCIITFDDIATSSDTGGQGGGETPVAQCSDNLDNDTDGLIDAKDPGCHSNFNANDPGTYNPLDNDETNVPEVASGASGGGSGGGGGGGNGPIAGGAAFSPGAGGTSGGGSSNNGQVLGTSTSASCGPLLSTFMRKGKKSNQASEVTKLQGFLNTFMSAGLEQSGTFDQKTDVAVRAFQVKYTPDVLTPWNINRSTGYVYLTTQRWINLLYCPTLSIPMPILVPDPHSFD